MSFIATAIVGSAVVGGAASIISGNKAASASKDAAKTSAAVERYIYDTTREDYKPQLDTGNRALLQLAGMSGITPSDDTLKQVYGEDEDGNPLAGDFIPGDYSKFYDSPDYNFTYDQGMRAVNQSLAARGLSPDTGPGLKALTRFGQGLASQQLNNYRNSLASLAGIGQNATGAVSQAGSNYATGAGNAYTRAGDARASAYLNTGSAISGMANNVGQIGLLKAFGAF